MTNTELKSISDRSIQYNEYKRSKVKKARVHPMVQFKRKRMLTDKMRAIGEEFLAWLLIISTITVLILFFSNLH